MPVAPAGSRSGCSLPRPGPRPGPLTWPEVPPCRSSWLSHQVLGAPWACYTWACRWLTARTSALLWAKGAAPPPLPDRAGPSSAVSLATLHIAVTRLVACTVLLALQSRGSDRGRGSGRWDFCPPGHAGNGGGHRWYLVKGYFLDNVTNFYFHPHSEKRSN